MKYLRAWIALLLLPCTPALAQNTMPNASPLPGAGLPVFALAVIAGLAYWIVRRRRAKKN
jgi:hypothetical protein